MPSSIVGSMQKRHGLIIESAILEAVGNLPNYTEASARFPHKSRRIAAVSSANNVKNNPDCYITNNSYPYTVENSARPYRWIWCF